MATYCFVPLVRKAKFCSVPSRVIVEIKSAVGIEKVTEPFTKDHLPTVCHLLGCDVV